MSGCTHLTAEWFWLAMMGDEVQLMVGQHVVVEVAARCGLHHVFRTPHDGLALRRGGAACGVGGQQALQHAAGLDHVQVIGQVDV